MILDRRGFIIFSVRLCLSLFSFWSPYSSKQGHCESLLPQCTVAKTLLLQICSTGLAAQADNSNMTLAIGEIQLHEIRIQDLVKRDKADEELEDYRRVTEAVTLLWGDRGTGTYWVTDRVKTVINCTSICGISENKSGLLMRRWGWCEVSSCLQKLRIVYVDYHFQNGSEPKYSIRAASMYRLFTFCMNILFYKTIWIYIIKINKNTSMRYSMTIFGTWQVSVFDAMDRTLGRRYWGKGE